MRRMGPTIVGMSPSRSRQETSLLRGISFGFNGRKFSGSEPFSRHASQLFQLQRINRTRGKSRGRYIFLFRYNPLSLSFYMVSFFFKKLKPL